MKKIFLSVIFICTLFSSCQEELPSDPIVVTESVVAFSNSQFYAKARLVSDGDAPIRAYGFAVSRNILVSGRFSYAPNFSAGSNLEEDTFSLRITYDTYQTDSILYFHSYLENMYGIMYGKPYRLALNNFAPQYIIPDAAAQGDTVTITGKGFATSPEGNIVQFGEIGARVITASPTELTVIVPAGIHYSYDGIIVSVTKDGEKHDIYYFKVIPKVLSISPQSGTFDSEIQINFDNLPSPYYNYDVAFGSFNASKKGGNENSIKVRVPAYVKTKVLQVKVYNGITECKPYMNFTMDPMSITSISPVSGRVNTGILIYGKGFNPVASKNAVKIGNRFAFLESSRAGVLAPDVPAGLSPGTYDIHIYNSIDTLIIKNGFTVTLQ